MTADLPPIQPCADLPGIRALLAAAGLPTADLTAAPRADFWGGHEEIHLIGVIGLEGYGAVALLRSLAVAPAWHGGNDTPGCRTVRDQSVWCVPSHSGWWPVCLQPQR